MARIESPEKKIISFEGDEAYLSNFWYSPIIYQDLRYPTVEHAYQASKVTDIPSKILIANLPTPGKAKRYGRLVDLPANWNEIKILVMRELVDLKFKTHLLLRKRLFESSPYRLEEGNNHYDSFWGIYPPNSGQGENHLGLILEEIRSSIDPREFEMKDLDLKEKV